MIYLTTLHVLYSHVNFFKDDPLNDTLAWASYLILNFGVIVCFFAVSYNISASGVHCLTDSSFFSWLSISGIDPCLLLAVDLLSFMSSLLCMCLHFPFFLVTKFAFRIVYLLWLPQDFCFDWLFCLLHRMQVIRWNESLFPVGSLFFFVLLLLIVGSWDYDFFAYGSPPPTQCRGLVNTSPPW